jgi:hypothetical protein
MLYDTVEINPSGNGKWSVTFSSLNRQREEKDEYLPNAMGFFHYPRKWGKQKGFNILKNYMIKQHEQEIARLRKSLKALKSVSYNEQQREFNNQT